MSGYHSSIRSTSVNANTIHTQEAKFPYQPKKWMNLQALAQRPVGNAIPPWTIMSRLTLRQWMAFGAAFWGWTLDSLDFFLIMMAYKDIAAEFDLSPMTVTAAITLTQMVRPIGAVIFGLAADKWGRKWPLIFDVAAFSLIELLSSFAPSFNALLAFRILFGVAMGGEWGLGVALAMETLPTEARGLFSGILQSGYIIGYLLAALLHFTTKGILDWRVLLWIGATPGMGIIILRFLTPESEAWKSAALDRLVRAPQFWPSLKRTMTANLKLASYCIVLMTCFAWASHGSQDLYPGFLDTQLFYTLDNIIVTVVVYNVGGLLGSITLGWASQYLGRRRTIVAAAILSACFIPLWSAAEAPFGGIAVGGFFMQFFLQGAWGIIPIHLCELSPPNFRGFFPGFIYHCGNLVAATAAWMEMALANTFVEEDGTPDLSPAMAIFVGTALLLMVIVTLAGPEEMGRELVCSEEYRPDLWRESISRSERANTDYSFSSAPSMDFV